MIAELTDIKTASTSELINLLPREFRLGGSIERQRREAHQLTDEQRLAVLELADRQDMVTANGRGIVETGGLPKIWSDIAATARRLANLSSHPEFAITALEQNGFDKGATVTHDHLLLSLLQERLAAAEAGREMSRSRLSLLDAALNHQINAGRNLPSAIRQQIEGLEKRISRASRDRHEGVKKLVELGLSYPDAEARAKPSQGDVEQMKAELTDLREQMAEALEKASSYRAACLKKWPELQALEDEIERQQEGEAEPVAAEGHDAAGSPAVAEVAEVVAADAGDSQPARSSIVSRLLGR